MNKALYPPTDPLQKFPTPQTAGAVTPDDVKTYYAGVYRPDMTSVVVIGDITPEQARATFEKYFGEWKAQGPKPDVTLPAVPKNAPASFNVPDAARVQSQVNLAQVLDLKRADPDWATLQVGNNILGGGGFGSLLMNDIRVKHGYVYDVRSSIDSYKNRAEFTISYACDPNRIVPAQYLAIADLRSLQNGNISANDLQKSKAMLISDVPLRQQSFEGVSSQLLRFDSLGLPLNQATLDAQRELAATAQSVQSALKKWINPDRFVRVVQGPAPK
jgi:zinc protease